MSGQRAVGVRLLTLLMRCRIKMFERTCSESDHGTALGDSSSIVIRLHRSPVGSQSLSAPSAPARGGPWGTTDRFTFRKGLFAARAVGRRRLEEIEMASSGPIVAADDSHLRAPTRQQVAAIHPKLLPKSPLRIAMTYAQGQRQFLRRGFQDQRFALGIAPCRLPGRCHREARARQARAGQIPNQGPGSRVSAPWRSSKYRSPPTPTLPIRFPAARSSPTRTSIAPRLPHTEK